MWFYTIKNWLENQSNSSDNGSDDDGLIQWMNEVFPDDISNILSDAFFGEELDSLEKDEKFLDKEEYND